MSLPNSFEQLRRPADHRINTALAHLRTQVDHIVQDRHQWSHTPGVPHTVLSIVDTGEDGYHIEFERMLNPRYESTDVWLHPNGHFSFAFAKAIGEKVTEHMFDSQRQTNPDYTNIGLWRVGTGLKRLSHQLVPFEAIAGLKPPQTAGA